MWKWMLKRQSTGGKALGCKHTFRKRACALQTSTMYGHVCVWSRPAAPENRPAESLAFPASGTRRVLILYRRRRVIIRQFIKIPAVRVLGDFHSGPGRVTATNNTINNTRLCGRVRITRFQNKRKLIRVYYDEPAYA